MLGILHWLMTNQHAPVSLRESVVLRKRVSVRSTRATETGQWQLPSVRTEHARRYFNFPAVSLWNEAPAAVKETTSSVLCRKRTRKWRPEQDDRQTGEGKGAVVNVLLFLAMQ